MRQKHEENTKTLIYDELANIQLTGDFTFIGESIRSSIKFKVEKIDNNVPSPFDF